VTDPQGPAIRGGLHHLGFESVESVRAGKSLELRLDELDEGRARERLDASTRGAASSSPAR
jgi:phosphoribosylformylglycinamidine synthase subunit PurS